MGSSTGPAAGEATQARSEIRVVTVNLSTLDFAAAPLLDIIRAESPDVLLLVEFTRFWEERLQELDAIYPHRLKLPARGPFGLALLSRYELAAAKRFELTGTPAIEARVDVGAGSFTVLGVHLRPPLNRELALVRNRQLELLAELRATVSGPVMVIGDFNITPFSPFFAAWLAATGLRNAGAGRGPRFSWPAFLPILGIPIDHCFVSEEFEVTAYRRLPAFGSDHYPVLAELVLQ
jgi:endonuclease/exonuclease/phosphatase (EEP) superfamily protein YafD